MSKRTSDMLLLAQQNKIKGKPLFLPKTESNLVRNVETVKRDLHKDLNEIFESNKENTSPTSNNKVNILSDVLVIPSASHVGKDFQTLFSPDAEPTSSNQDLTAEESQTTKFYQSIDTSGRAIEKENIMEIQSESSANISIEHSTVQKPQTIGFLKSTGVNNQILFSPGSNTSGIEYSSVKGTETSENFQSTGTGEATAVIENMLAMQINSTRDVVVENLYIQESEISEITGTNYQIVLPFDTKNYDIKDLSTQETQTSEFYQFTPTDNTIIENTMENEIDSTKSESTEIISDSQDSDPNEDFSKLSDFSPPRSISVESLIPNQSFTIANNEFTTSRTSTAKSDHTDSKLGVQTSEEYYDNHESNEGSSQNSTFKLVTDETDEVEKPGRRNYKDRKDCCLFCDKDVSHFARHVSTWHANELDVQRILCMQNGSVEKKIAWSNLRKRGNFIKNGSNTKLRPVRRAQVNSKVSADAYLPCSYCFGFYKKKSLYRHTKHCTENSSTIEGKRQTSQSDGQTTLLLRTLIKHNELLKKELFPRMRADEITLTIKKDSLICNYGYSYLKGRRSKGNLDLVRQNMRRLAKLLRFAKSENNSVKELLDLLRPCHFQTIIKAVNEIARYNPETDIYESPTVAMNFGTLVKKCCDLAYIHLLEKPNTSEQRKDLKILKTLIDSQWSNEVSAQAATNLNFKKWNKEELIPLTSDLKKMNDFLKALAEEEYNKLLATNYNQSAYNILKEALYCQIILLNRRRPAEVAQLKVQTFKSVNLDAQGENEFDSCLTETEKILLKHYSRFVIRGKRGRGVPILLSPNMRKHFEYLINIRSNFVDKNDYIFHTSGQTFIDGTKVLYKYAKKCGIERAHSISATRLRKHLATVTQLLQFSERDLEQLSKFMGHTLKTHCNIYRLSDDVYQTAKVSKLLLLMTEGGAENFHGMNFDDIHIDLNPTSQEPDILEIIEEKNELHHDESETFSLENRTVIQNLPTAILNTSKHKTGQEIKKSSISNKSLNGNRVSWTSHQKKIIGEYFEKHIREKIPPKRKEIEEFINKYPQLYKNRKWTSIKAVVYNIYSGKLKLPAQATF